MAVPGGMRSPACDTGGAHSRRIQSGKTCRVLDVSNERRETDHQTEIRRRHEQSSKNGYSPERQRYRHGCEGRCRPAGEGCSILPA